MQIKTLTRFLVVVGLLSLFGCGQSSSTSGTSNPSSANVPAPGASESSSGGAPASGIQKAAEGIFKPKPIVIPAGTSIEVTADQSVSSKTSNPGDHFDASLAAPVIVGDKQVIPPGAKVIGTVTDAKSAGKFKGNAAITVTLDSVRVNGETYPLKTSSVTQSGKGRGERTAVGAGGGAAVGALIGAIAGHGKGAAIGAAAGAGAGTAGAAMTGDKDITIAAETKLSFKLKEPLEVKGK